MSLNAATAAPSGRFLVSRKKLSVIAQTHLISVSLKKPINGICYEGFIIFYFKFIKGKVKTK